MHSTSYLTDLIISEVRRAGLSQVLFPVKTCLHCSQEQNDCKGVHENKGITGLIKDLLRLHLPEISGS